MHIKNILWDIKADLCWGWEGVTLVVLGEGSEKKSPPRPLQPEISALLTTSLIPFMGLLRRKNVRRERGWKVGVGGGMSLWICDVSFIHLSLPYTQVLE